MSWLWKLAGIYLLYAGAMILAHPRFIYPFGPDPFDARGFRQEVVSDRNVTLAISEQTGDTAVLYFMGNGGALSYFAYSLIVHARAGRTVAAMEYPGGGGIPGTPSEDRLKADALAAYDWLVQHHDGPIVVHGYSMGTGLAQHVAAERPVAAIILDAPFVKMCELMARASWLPACILPGIQRWNSAALVPELSAPVLIQHGGADELIPIGHGQRLAGLMHDAGLDVSFHAVPDATHVDLVGHPGYQTRIDEFLARVLAQ
ncbi:MAG: alpha/beta fold hydrolase [Rhodobacteraceae bacterium]|nr:alpha/beta fold hydrolase [Paracoccaceae bacterium]